VNEPRDRDPADSGAGDAESRLASDAVRGLPPVAADPALREELKAAFASGTIESARDPKHERRAPIPFPWGSGRPVPAWQTTVAIAALILAIVMAGVLNQGPAWRIAAIRGAGAVRLDGTSLSVADSSALGRPLPAGVRIEVSDGAELDLRADGVMAMQCAGGTDLVLPPSPPRWFARHAALHVQRGEIRVTTGPTFKGAKLTVTTPEAALAVTGTTFAVILESTGTCVCVYQGTVMVGPRGARGVPVRGGRLRYIHRDGSAPSEGPMRDVERDRLAQYVYSQRDLMEGNAGP